MRKAVLLMVAMAVLSSMCVLAQAAPRWDLMCEGAAIPSPWYFSAVTGNGYYETECDPVTMEWVAKLLDDDPAVNNRLQRDQLYTPQWNGMTFHCRFKVVSAPDNTVRLQLSEDKLPDTTAGGYTRWHWYNTDGGQMVLKNGTLTSGSNTFPAPANQWVEIWMTISRPNWEIYLWNGSAWNLVSAGTVDFGGGVSCLGSGSTSEIWVDFLRHHTHGAFGPNDPNKPVLPAATNRIGEAKLNYIPGLPVSFPNKMVTASWIGTQQPEGAPMYNYFVIQEDDRSAGVKVRRTAASADDKWPVGSRVDLNGYVDRLGQEIFIAPNPVPAGLTTAAPAPDPIVLPDALCMYAQKVGGVTPFGCQPGVWFGNGIGPQSAHRDAGVGLNTAGLRVRICGKVLGKAPNQDPATGFSVYYINDADLVYNDSLQQNLLKYPDPEFLAWPGIKVYVPSTVVLTIDEWVGVTGIAGIEEGETATQVLSYQVIYATQPGDVAPL